MKLNNVRISSILIILSMLIGWWVTAELIQPMLHYHYQQIAFVNDISFFTSFLKYPGGLSDYLSIFVSQFFYFNTFGSFLIITVASVQGIIALWLLNKLSPKHRFLFSAFALVLIFGTIVLCNYRYPYYASIRLLISFLTVASFIKVLHKYPKSTVFSWPLITLLLYYLAGGVAIIVFAISTAVIYIHSPSNKKKWLTALLIVVFSAVLPYLAYVIFVPISLKNLYGITFDVPPYMIVYKPEWALYLYYALLPAILFAGYISKIINKFPNKDKTKVKNNIEKKRSNQSIIIGVQLIACMGLAYFVFDKLYNSQKKYQLLIEHYAENEQWKEVLKTTAKVKEYDFRVNFQVNRAFAHLEQLPERLMEYPQLLGTYGLFIDATMAGSVAIPTSDLYYDLGMMSMAQKWAFEAQTLLPNSPRILKRLVMVNLVTKKYELAQKFLSVLDKNPLYHTWVSEHQRFVTDTSLTNSDAEIAQKRLYNPPFNMIMDNGYETLKVLYKWNPNNRMAYDYLLAYSLLGSYLKQFIHYIPDYSKFKLVKLPKVWEEVIAIYIATHDSIPSNLNLVPVSEQTMKRFSEFTNVLISNKYNLAASQGLLLQIYGDTYWYWAMYKNPKVTGALNNMKQVQ